MSDDTFKIGDYVEVTCSDGVKFYGWLADVTDDFILLDGPAGQRGFADAQELAHA